MARTKQARKRARSATPYVQRLLEDRHAQEQLRSAASSLRAVYRRASRQGAQATEDKRLYGQLRQSATSIRAAIVALQQPQPQPKHRARKLAGAALIGGGAVLTLKRSSANTGHSETSEGAVRRTPEPESAAKSPAG
jgi:hypothetical protein